MAEQMIPISTVRTGAAEEELVLQVLRSGMLAQGPMVERLESTFADWIGVEHAVAVNNGTTALVASLQALEISPGDEVITSPFTFVATLNAILEAGATARFADISLDDFALNAEQLPSLINERTRVVMPVHLYGQAADMPAIVATIGESPIALVEDAAQAHGATVGGRSAGTFGIGCFSLYATKNFTTGEGGIITTSDDAIADRLRLLRNQGMRARYQYEMAGHNYRLTDLQAAVGIPQLERAEEISSARRHNAAVLTEGLSGIEGLVTPVTKPGRDHVFHQYTVRVTDEARVTRDELLDQLLQSGIGSGIYYPKAVYDYDCYRNHPSVGSDPTPNAETAALQVLSLPVHPYLSSGDLERIIDGVRSALGA